MSIIGWHFEIVFLSDQQQSKSQWHSIYNNIKWVWNPHLFFGLHSLFDYHNSCRLIFCRWTNCFRSNIVHAAVAESLNGWCCHIDRLKENYSVLKDTEEIFGVSAETFHTCLWLFDFHLSLHPVYFCGIWCRQNDGVTHLLTVREVL